MAKRSLLKQTSSLKLLELYDNTRVSTSRICLRKFYFRHVRHWAPVTTRAALVFGGSWHKAMDVLYPMLMSPAGRKAANSRSWNDYKEEVILKTFAAFQANWVAEGFPGVDDMGGEEYENLRPRVPTTALEMLYEYLETRRIYLTTGDAELIAVEQPFVVPLDPNNDSLFYVGRFDKVIRKDRRILGIEHKTTTAYSKTNGFRDSFIASFSPNSQVDGYQHAGVSTYGKEFKGIQVDAALVHRNETAFRWIPVERQLSQLDAWLWETQYWINQIQANRDALADARPKDKYLGAFPKNTSSCIAYEQTCEYLDLCKSWSNPEGYDLPAGFRMEKWEPFEELHLEKVFGSKAKEK